MPKIQTKSEKTVPVMSPSCGSSRSHDVVWAFIVLFTLVAAGTPSLFLMKQRDVFEQPTGLQEKAPRTAIPDQAQNVEPCVDTSTTKSTYKPTAPSKHLDWIDVSFQYPEGWFAVSQSYRVDENNEVGYVLTLNPTLIDFPVDLYSQPFYLRISRLRSSSKTIQQILDEARGQFRKFDEVAMTLHEGMNLHDIYGEQDRSGVGTVFAHDYYIVITGGDNLDQYADEQAIIYHLEPKAPNLIVEGETYDTVIKAVQEIIWSLQRYQYP